MNILKHVTTLFGWLAGSLTAISALLCVFGFIIVRSQSNLLGLGDFLRYTNDQYLIEGARFLLHTTIYANEIVLRLVTLLMVLLVIPLFILPKTGWYHVVLRKCRYRISVAAEKYGWLIPSVVMALLLYIFLARFIPYLDAFKEPTDIRELLTTTTATDAAADGCTATMAGSKECIRQDILQGNRTALEGLYFNLSLCYFEVAIVLGLVYHFSANWPKKTLVRLPFSAIFLAYTLLMPMCYGILIKPIELSPLLLELKNDPDGPAADGLYLLQKSADAFIAWNSVQRKIVWYPVGSVAKATISSRRQLFPLPPATKDGAP